MGGGLLGAAAGMMGAIDFAGGTVVHIASGIAALVAAAILAPRSTWPNSKKPPHNVPFILLGVGLLWFGWFGFNGARMFASKTAGLPFLTTTTAVGAATACLIAVLIKATIQFDDSLDTFMVHGVGGTLGALLTGIFASKALVPADYFPAAAKVLESGGNVALFLTLLKAVLFTYGFVAIGTATIL
jgi:Amt family ammonium transporter